MPADTVPVDTVHSPSRRPLWPFVAGAVLLAMLGVIGSAWLPELRERATLRRLSALPGAKVVVHDWGWAGDVEADPRIPYIPDHSWLNWLHGLRPPLPRSYDVSIGPAFPLDQLPLVAGLRSLIEFDATETELGDSHMAHVCHALDLRLDGTHVGDAGLRTLEGKEIGAISLANTPVTGAGMPRFPQLVSIGEIRYGNQRLVSPHSISSTCYIPATLIDRRVDLSGTRLDDEGLMTLADKVRGTPFNLARTRITNSALRNLAARDYWWSPELILDGTGIGDEGLAAVFSGKSPKDFSLLSLSGTQVTWEYWETLTSCPEELHLAGLDIRNRCANWFLEHGENCHTLDLSNTRLTDVGLEALEGCGGLRRLRVKGCEISEAAARRYLEAKLTSLPADYVFGCQPTHVASRLKEFQETGWLWREP